MSDELLQGAASEHAALRRVATLVARRGSLRELAQAIVEEVGRVFDVPMVTLDRYEREGSVVLASLNDPAFPAGSYWPHDGPSLGRTVFRTGRPTRIDDYATLSGSAAEAARGHAVGSTAGVPVVVGGRVWGVICVGVDAGQALPAAIETRLGQFAELLTAAIANADARDDLHRLAEEQAALRRLATLAAESGRTAELFGAVVEEVARIVGVPEVTLDRFDPDGSSTVLAAFDERGEERWPVGSRWPLDGPSVARQVRDTGRPASIDDYSAVESTIARVYHDRPLTRIVGVPIVAVGEVWGMIGVGTPDANPTPAEMQLRLAEFLQLITTGIGKAEAEERATRLAAEQAALGRVATLAAKGTALHVLLAEVAREVSGVLDAPAVTVERDGRPLIVWGDAAAPGLAEVAGAPIRVDGAPWGSIRVAAPAGWHAALDPGERLGGFCELASTAVASTEARARLRRLANEQAALRRIATLVAERAPAERLVAAVDDEAGRLLGGARVTIEPVPPDGSADAEAPILVEGAVWGRISARPGGAGAAELLARFGELVATAIANARAREEVRTLLAEQAALRRVATLVAEGASASRLFSAVTDEVSRLLEVPIVTLDRFEDGAATTVLAATHAGAQVTYPVGSRWPLDGPSVAASIQATGRAARIDDYSGLPGTTARAHRVDPQVSSFGVPIVVDGRLWGMIGVGSTPSTPLPADTEARLTRFTELVATAVSNATARAELIASRTRLVVAGDDARSRIERTLHDGPRARLAALGDETSALRASVPTDEAELAASLLRVEQDIRSVLAQIAQLSRGLHPELLARHGIGRSIEELAARCPIPVELDLRLAERPPEPVEIGVYYVVSEALTNAAKHSRAARVRVSLRADDACFAAAIADDGIGGAEASRGSGLSGLADRVVALGGRFALDSPPGGGTRIAVDFPRDARR